jgi:succinate dehydrogenase/fumarate reductase flavoprotein subunit
MAYHAGAELMNMELVLYVGTLDHPRVWRGILVPTLFKVGGDTLHLLNRHGERFMTRYDPEHLEMATKDVIARSLQMEIQAGRGGGEGDTLYADLRHLPYEETKQKLLDLVVCMEKMGLDVRKDLITFRPAAHETLGGIRINARCESTVSGLYAAGSAIGAIYGNDGIPGRGTGHALVFGKRAGEYAGKRAQEMDLPSIQEEQVETERQRVFGLLDQEGGNRPIGVLKKLQQIMEKHFWVVKNGAGLQEALRGILSLREEDLPKLGLSCRTKRFNLEWRWALEMSNLIDLSEMMVRSALMRKESRTTFLREDYPDTDDTNWLKHIVVKKGAGHMNVTAIPIQLTHVQPQEND